MQKFNLKVISNEVVKTSSTPVKKIMALILCSTLQISTLALPALSILTTSCGKKSDSPAVGSGGTESRKAVRYRIEIISDTNPNNKLVIEKSAEELKGLISE